MLIYLINPRNTMTSLVNVKEGFGNSIRIWKPLGLLILAGLTPGEHELEIIDENRGIPDYLAKRPPGLVGITAFTSQAPRAYEIAALFRQSGVPVVMGGIHASMRSEEALEWVDAVVIGEAESIWHQVLKDCRHHTLKKIYKGDFIPLEQVPQVPHHILTKGYFFGSIQTTRGCPLNCNFCSVTAFNGNKYRHRPVAHIIKELQSIKEKFVLIVDDNLIGVNKNHYQRAKELFTAIIKAKIKKRFIAQVTLNMADDPELLALAKKAGLSGIFIGFESAGEAGLLEVQKKFNIRKSDQIASSIRSIQKKGILVLGSFIMGLDVDKKGIGKTTALAGIRYELDALNLMFLTPLPGTRLWDKFASENRIAAKNLPADWKYYTLAMPVAHYMHLSWEDMFEEMRQCFTLFYALPQIWSRFFKHLLIYRKPLNALFTLFINLNYRQSLVMDEKLFRQLNAATGTAFINNAGNLAEMNAVP